MCTTGAPLTRLRPSQGVFPLGDDTGPPARPIAPSARHSRARIDTFRGPVAFFALASGLKLTHRSCRTSTTIKQDFARTFRVPFAGAQHRFPHQMNLRGSNAESQNRRESRGTEGSTCEIEKLRRCLHDTKGDHASTRRETTGTLGKRAPQELHENKLGKRCAQEGGVEVPDRKEGNTALNSTATTTCHQLPATLLQGGL